MKELEVVERALNLFQEQDFKIFKKPLILTLNFLEKIFGSEVLIKIPEELIDYDFSLLDALKVGLKLKEFGIIKEINQYSKYPDEPFIYNYYSRETRSGGAHIFDKRKALWGCLAESVERYLWFNSDYFYKKNFLFKSYQEIKSQAINIFDLAGFSQEQKDNIEILKFDEKTKFGWTKVFSLIKNKNIYCPVQLLSAFYFSQKVRTLKNEPMLRWSITTGLATYKTLEEAIIRGILEIIERDAFMITWLNKISPPIIDLDYLALQDKDIEKIKSIFERYNLELYVLKLPTDFSLNVLAAIIIDRSGLGPAFSIGARASFNLKTALLDCVSEALSVRYSLKNRFRQDIDLNNINREERLIYYAKQENLFRTEFLIKGEKIKIDLTYNNIQKTEEKLNILIQELKRKNYEAVYAELTTPEIKKLGLRIVFVVIPELQPLHLSESIPYFGGKRLKEVPLKLGYQPLDNLNKDPHPFP